jgi:hypothetical protein
MAKKSGKKAAPKRPAAKAVVKKKRSLKQFNYKSLKPHKPVKHPVKLPNVWQLTRKSALTLWRHKKLFIGITIVYGLLNIVLAGGLSGGTDIESVKHTLNQLFKGQFSGLASGLSIFALLISSASNNSNPTAGAYQFFLALIASLSIIWALRQVSAGAAKVRIRDTYYRGMYPLIPFVLVLLVIGLELIPLLVGSTIYGVVIGNGIAASLIEKIVWTLVFGLTAFLSLYLISSSLMALYIVTLPDMAPMKALRSARGLVRYRRWTVLRKILAMPLILLVSAAIIMVPIIIFLTPLAQWVFFLLTLFGLIALHTYMYTLYRELLNE